MAPVSENISQEKRLGKLHPPAPLGPDDLVLLRFSGHEAVNDLFEFTVEAMSPKSRIDLDGMVGKSFTVELTTFDGSPRYFDGILTSVHALGLHKGGMGYELTLQPMISVMDKRQNKRIFNNKTPQDIITEVLSAHGFTADFAVSGMEPQEFIVQYGESDLAFIKRMMERFGLNFYFTHASGDHKMKINDGNFADVIPGSTRKIGKMHGRHLSDEEHFDSWLHNRQITPGQVKVTDYNFKTPNANLYSTQTGDAQYKFNNLESFAYPAGQLDAGGAKKIAGMRLKQLRAADNRHRATGDVMSLAAGMKVTVQQFDATDTTWDPEVDGQTFVALSAQHSFTASAYSSGFAEGQGGEDSYRGSYEFSPEKQPVLPAMQTPRAVMHGPHVGIVVGEGEIDCDEHGRILVKFPWDPVNDSMRCRVLQPWAGAGWGNVFIPRVGMEVVCEFLDGDPDRPLVIGSLYNGENTPPYGLPGSKNIAGMKSNSTPGGGGYNEMVMDDSAGSELIRVHAQYNLDTTVENDETREVKNNRTTKIDNNDDRTVISNDTEKVDGNQKSTVVGNRETTVNGNDKQTVDGKREATIGTTYEIKAGTSFKVTAGGASVLEMTGSNITLTIGGSKIEMDPGKIKVTTGQFIVNSASIDVESAGVAKYIAGGMLSIAAPMVKINS